MLGIVFQTVEGQRQGKGMQAHSAQGLIDQSHVFFMREGRIGVGIAWRFRGIRPGGAVGEIPVLGLIVKGREIGITDGPGRRHSIAVLAWVKIFFPAAQYRGAIELGITAHMIAGHR